MKRLFVMMCLIVLGACSGGGGTHGGMSDVRQSNLIISSNIDNETRRSAHVAHTLGSGNRDGRANPCGNSRACNDVAFENMKYWLIDNIESVDECNDYDNLRDALLMAGFSANIGTDLPETKEWVQNNAARIKNQATEIYNELGIHQDFDITKSELDVLNGIDFTTTEPSKIVFHVNDKNKITGITFHDSVGSSAGLDFPGTRDHDTSRFTIQGHAHIYKLEEIAPQYCNYAQYNHYIEIKSLGSLSLAQLKERLIQYADDEFAKGTDGFFGTFDPEIDLQDVYNATVAQINAIDSMNDVSYEHFARYMDMDLQSFGKYVGLAYSDFGRLVIPNPSTPNAHLIYHGGYEDNLVSDAHMNELANNTTTDMTFRGRAVGKIEQKTILNEQSDMKMDAIKTAGNATLNFKGTNNGAQETLHIEFPDWYDVTVTKTPDNNRIHFANYSNNNDKFKFYVPDDGLVEEHTVDNFIGQNGSKIGAFQVNYYALDQNSNPSEASGHLSFGQSESYGDPYPYHSVELQSTFGVIRDYEKNDE